MPEANHVVHEGKLVVNSIVRLKQYNANVVKGKQYAIRTLLKSLC